MGECQFDSLSSLLCLVPLVPGLALVFSSLPVSNTTQGTTDPDYMCCSRLTTSLLVGLVAILVGYLYFSLTSDSLTQTGNTYTAHLSCSILFGTSRELESAKEAEFVFPPVVYGRIFQVDYESRCVTTSLSLRKELSTTYCWTSERLGCSRVGTHAPETPVGSHESNLNQPWPSGEDVETMQATQAKQTANLTCLTDVVRSHFEGDARLHSRAFVVLKDNHVIFEKYKPGWNYETRLHGWSMTKSILNTLIGIRIQQQHLTLETRLSDLFVHPHQSELHPTNSNITIAELLTMTEGMDTDEIYLPGSETVQMLFEKPSLMEFGKKVGRRQRGAGCFQYSSLATNYLSAALARSFATKADYLQFPTQALFEVLGMQSALMETDSKGIFIASSFSWMTARDWGRLGLLYANDGVWEGVQVLPKGWVDLSRTPTATSRNVYGMHFWLGGLKDSVDADHRVKEKKCDETYPARVKNRNVLRNAFPKGSMLMKGFEDQIVAIHPESKTVVVRLGATKPVVVSWEQEKFYTQVYQCLNV